MNSMWNLETLLVKVQVVMLWHSVLNQVRASKGLTIIYSGSIIQVWGIYERLSCFILCIWSCSSLSPDWLFTTEHVMVVPGRSAEIRSVLCKDVWWPDCRRNKDEHSFVFVMKKPSSLEKTQSFKISIADLFVSIKLINDFWMGNIRFFLWAGVFMGTFATCSIRLLYNSDVFWLK